jgi:hypothetical protein
MAAKRLVEERRGVDHRKVSQAIKIQVGAWNLIMATI